MKEKGKIEENGKKRRHEGKRKKGKRKEDKKIGRNYESKRSTKLTIRAKNKKKKSDKNIWMVLWYYGG
jgi:hypothetical protein